MKRFFEIISAIILIPIAYIFAVLPLFILYGVADLLFVIMYFLIGYRKKVVRENLRNSFSGKSINEIKTIEKKFYRHFCDIFIETLKVLTISKKSLLKRCKIDSSSIKLLNQLYSEKKSIILVQGHHGNWELSAHALTLQLQHNVHGVYHPLSNKAFDKFIYFIRTRFGLKLYSMNETLKGMMGNKDEITATLFIADQSPMPEGAFWIDFLNQDTPVFKGSEKIAKKLGFPVVFFDMRKIKRGYYEISMQMVSENPKNTAEGDISIIHTNLLEEKIIQQPETWLWSHKRWKHKRKA